MKRKEIKILRKVWPLWSVLLMWWCRSVKEWAKISIKIPRIFTNFKMYSKKRKKVLSDHRNKLNFTKRNRKKFNKNHKNCSINNWIWCRIWNLWSNKFCSRNWDLGRYLIYVTRRKEMKMRMKKKIIKLNLRSNRV